MPNCDIIIPTYNNERVIMKTIEALFCQEAPSGWQVRLIASDDESTDSTARLVSSVKPAALLVDCVVISGPHSGAGAARNRALKRSTADIVFFLGADILLRPGALATHLQWHATHPQPTNGALGVIRWDPRLKPTPFMEWMMHGGQQNNYDALLGSTTTDPAQHCYGSHLSLKRSLIGKIRFPTELGPYGWEDLAFGQKTKQCGLVLHVLHNAIGLHCHNYSAEDILQRQRRVGFSAFAFGQRRHSRRRLVKHSLFTYSGCYYLLRLFIKMYSQIVSTPYLFNMLTAFEFWKGYKMREKVLLKVFFFSAAVGFPHFSSCCPHIFPQ